MSLRHQIFSKPEIPRRIDINAHADAMKGDAGQVNAMPTRRRLVDHALLHAMHTRVRCWKWSSPADAFATVAITGEALVGDALALGAAIGTGVAKTTVEHVPTVQPRTTGQRCIPAKSRQATYRPI